MKFVCSLMVGIMLAAISGCTTGPKKIPCSDIDMYAVFRNEISILQDSRISPQSEQKFNAAKKLYQYVDFSFARDTDNLTRIFGVHDANKSSVMDEDALVFQYSWKNDYVRFIFLGHGNSVTSSEVKLGKFE